MLNKVYKRTILLSCIIALFFIGCEMTETESPTAVDNATLAKGSSGGKDIDGSSTRVYRVTLENLTTGQPFSPGVVVTHTKKHSVFEVGEAASEGIRLIAEDGTPVVSEFTGGNVHEVVATPMPVGCDGCGAGPFPAPLPTKLTVEITARANFNRLSLAVMLICTNDGFTGLDGIKLPGGFKPQTFYAAGYDAGTEDNDQLFTSIVDPCGGIGPVSVAPDGLNNRTATDDVISHHPGIIGGVGDLDPAEHGWDNPVLKVTIQRVKGVKKFMARPLDTLTNPPGEIRGQIEAR